MAVAAARILMAWWRSSSAGAWPQGEERQPNKAQNGHMTWWTTDEAAEADCCVMWCFGE
jgi:hypothetical protein